MQFQQGNLLKGIENCLFDLQYKLVRSPWTTVSATSFLYFKLKVYKRLPKSKKLPMLKKIKKMQKYIYCQTSYTAQKLQF